jgi:hypothetical protein
MDYKVSDSSPKMGMMAKKKAVAAKIATKKTGFKPQRDSKGFLSVSEVMTMKKSGKFKGFDANPENSKKPKE